MPTMPGYDRLSIKAPVVTQFRVINSILRRRAGKRVTLTETLAQLISAWNEADAYAQKFPSLTTISSNGEETP